MRERLDPSVIGELLGLLAHDLRNPLSALHSNLGFLRSVAPAGDTDSREAIDDGLVSCDGLAHIIDNIDLLGLSLRDGAPGEGSVVDVAAVASDVITAARAMAQSHSVDLEWLPPPAQPPATAHGSREQIGRALSNLLRNSIQHSPVGGSVRVSVRGDAQQVTVLIEDAGVPLAGPAAEGAFTAAGQVGSKSIPNGRYSRGFGLYSARLAALAGHASVRAVTPASGLGNAFELIVGRKA